MEALYRYRDINKELNYENKIFSDYNMMKEKDVGREFMEILKNGDITTVFQPIISLKDGELLGYEALSRGPKKSFFENPEKMFDFARIHGRLWELEFLCRIKALESVPGSDSNFLIFLNVDPHIIDDEKFKKGFTKEFLRNFDINPERIVFEITEKNSVTDFIGFRKVIENYKEQGYKIAIDDTGSGYSGLKLITEVHPHYIKLDMNLIRDIDKDGLKHALIKTFYDFCRVTDIKLIAEGIETENELNTLIEIGIDYGQGYLIQKPAEELIPISGELIGHIKERNFKKSEFYLSKPSTVLVGDICRKNITVESANTGADVLEIFNSNPSVYGLPVVDNDKLTGLIMKDKFYTKLGTQYGFALFVNRPVSIIMDKRPLTVDYETTIDIVSKLAMTRIVENLYDYIVITKKSKFFGIVTVKDLLEKTTEMEINYARHLNPLSGLPGNILIEQRLTSYISKTSPFSVLYIDIDNFKIYNDLYGFENGDRVIQYVSKIIQDCVLENSGCDCFIGHIGGDDFIIVMEGYGVESVCRKIIEVFDSNIFRFYASEDIEKKYIIAKNRYGNEEKFGLISLSIAGVRNKDKVFEDIYRLSEYSSRLKKKCKEINSSCYVIE